MACRIRIKPTELFWTKIYSWIHWYSSNCCRFGNAVSSHQLWFIHLAIVICSLIAGPSFILTRLMRWSSDRWGRVAPSIHWSPNVCNNKHKHIYTLVWSPNVCDNKHIQLSIYCLSNVCNTYLCESNFFSNSHDGYNFPIIVLNYIVDNKCHILWSRFTCAYI